MSLKSFGAARADRSGNNFDWTPVELVREMLREMEAGRLDYRRVLVIGVKESGEEGAAGSSWTVEAWRSQLNRSDEAYLLMAHQASMFR